jgi:hypothetical protein
MLLTQMYMLAYGRHGGKRPRVIDLGVRPTRFAAVTTFMLHPRALNADVPVPAELNIFASAWNRALALQLQSLSTF